MALRTDAYFRNLVEEALRDAGLTEPPVSLEGLASHLGVPVAVASLPIFFRAALVYEDGLPAILVNDQGLASQRFKALAHVLSHLLIVLDDPDSAYPRGERSEHRAADVMADELVLPAFMIREQARKWFNDYRYMARLFAMPENVVMDRMLELGIIKQRGIIWDY